MRDITHHKIGVLNEEVSIAATDNPSEGGASHAYTIKTPRAGGVVDQVALHFQEGPIRTKADINGISIEALVAIAIDRLEGFQGILTPKTGVAGGFACKENACALTHLQEAMMWLHKRTLDRRGRGVEGKREV